MRWKIIVANCGIVLVVGLLTYALLATSLGDVVENPAHARDTIQRAVQGANARLALDALELERWLVERLKVPSVADVFSGGTSQARQESASAQSNRIRDDAVQAAALHGLSPSVVLFVDAQGVVLGRNGSALMRGEHLGDVYPVVKRVLSEGGSTSDVWINKKRQEQMLVSLAAVKGDAGVAVGAVVVGVPINDERMRRVSEMTSGQPLFFGLASDKGVEIIAGDGSLPGAVGAELSARAPSGLAVARSALKTGNVAVADAGGGDWAYAVGSLNVYRGQGAVLISAMPISLVPSITGLLAPVLGVTALGLILVIVAGTLIGNYFSRPVSELEDGLLAIINGNQGLRFQIEHAELGGLVFRINSLLNALMGVPEDTTDEQGRPSVSPTASDFEEVLSVDETYITSQQANPAVVAALAGEPSEQYYSRVYAEYLDAKRRIGDPIEGNSYDGFVSRIQAMEQELGAKYSRPVRHMVEVRDGSIVLVAVPLS